MGAPRLAAALLAALTWGCATAVPRPEPLPAGDPRPVQMLARLQTQAKARTALRAELKLSLDGPAGSGTVPQALALQRPARLRVEVRGFLSQTLAVLVTDGGRYDFVRAEDRHFESGRVYPGLLRDVAQVELTPEEAVGLLLGAPAPPFWLQAGAALGLPDGGVRVDLRDDAGVLRQVIDFDSGGRLLRLEDRDVRGALRFEARFAGYRVLARGEHFAHDIELRFPASGASAVVRFSRVELNPELPDAIFELHDPRGTAPGGA